MKSRLRQRQQDSKVARKRAAMDRPGGRSNYARKRTFLRTNGGWGKDYPNKPWRSSR